MAQHPKRIDCNNCNNVHFNTDHIDSNNVPSRTNVASKKTLRALRRSTRRKQKTHTEGHSRKKTSARTKRRKPCVTKKKVIHGKTVFFLPPKV